MTTKTRLTYQCAACGWQSVKWMGRCSSCGEWGSLREGVEAGSSRLASIGISGTGSVDAAPIAEIDVEDTIPWPTGNGELDRVLGGGIVPGSLVLLSGEPGIGKSTLLLQTAARVALLGRKVLYLSAEESAGQVRLRAERIGALAPTLLLGTCFDTSQVAAQVGEHSPDLLIVDSVQTFTDASSDSAPGTPGQVRAVAGALAAICKSRSLPCLLVGHVTKDGAIAGPRTLEHLVDVVCFFEGDRHSQLRLCRTIKNRYGPADEVGCFDMTEQGIREVPDPSGVFVSRNVSTAGCAVGIAMEGRRALATEIQALVAPSVLGTPRRTTSGVDSSRLAMILAVLTRRLGVGLADQDVYVSTVAGARVAEPAMDLAIAMACLSARTDIPVPASVVALGEVGLAGDIRRVPQLERRLTEAGRMGFKTALVSSQEASIPGCSGLQVVPVTDLSEVAMRLNDRVAVS